MLKSAAGGTGRNGIVTDEERFGRSERLVRPGPLARRLLPSPLDIILIGAFSLALFPSLTDSTTWWRLHSGAWILQHYDVPRATLFTFAAPETPWLDREWLAHAVLAWIAVYLGPGMLVFLRSFLVAVAAGLLYAYLRRRGGVVPSFLLSLGVAAGFLANAQLHPVLFAHVLLTGLVLLLEHPDWRRGRAVVLIPLLFFLWTNLSPSFLVGLVILLSHTYGASMDWRRRRDDASWQLRLGCALLAFLFTFWNPYYGETYLRSLEDIWQLFASTPIQLQLLPGLQVVVAALLVCAVTLSLVLAGREIRWRMVYPFVALTPLPFLAPSYVGLWIIWTAVVLMEHLQQFAARVRHERHGFLEDLRVVRSLRRLGDRFAAFSTYDRYIVRGTWMALFGVLALSYFSVPPAQERVVGPLRFRGIVYQELAEAAGLPWKAVDALVHVSAPVARVLTLQEWGGYVGWEGRGILSVFVDSREVAYPLDVLEDYDRFADGRSGWEDVLDRYGVEAIVWPKEAFQPRALLTAGGWKTLYVDEEAIVIVSPDSFKRDGPSRRARPSSPPHPPRKLRALHRRRAGPKEVDSPLHLFRENRGRPGAPQP